jgi:hypothetical protein
VRTYSALLGFEIGTMRSERRPPPTPSTIGQTDAAGQRGLKLFVARLRRQIAAETMAAAASDPPR